MENMAVVCRNEVVDLPIAWIKSNPFQARSIFQRKSIKDLAKSICQYGVLQPICVRKLCNSSYEVVLGERRLKACKAIGMFYIPCIIVDISDLDCATVSLVENIHEQSLDFFEEARGYYNIIKDYGCSTYDVARMVGKSEKYIIDKLEMLSLNNEFKRIVVENDFSEEQVMALIKIKDKDLLRLVLKKVVAFGLNVRRTIELVGEVLQVSNFDLKIMDKVIDDIILNFGKKESKFKYYINDVRVFINTISQAVDFIRETGAKTDCIFDEKDDEIEVVIKIKK